MAWNTRTKCNISGRVLCWNEAQAKLGAVVRTELYIYIYVCICCVRCKKKQLWCCTAFNSSPRVLHICVSELGQRWFRWWFVDCSSPSHYLNQCWIFANDTIRNKFQWNSNQDSHVFPIHKNTFENVGCKMQPWCGSTAWQISCLVDVL